MIPIRILFICHGNICRSVAAEMVMRQLVEERHLEKKITVASAAATDEELGHDIYPPMKRALLARSIPCHPHAASKTVRGDAARYDLLIGMDDENLEDMRRIYGPEAEDKLSLLLSWAGDCGPVEDPWYTRDFDGALDDILRGCRGLADTLERQTFL